MVLNFLEIVGSGGIQKIVSNGREYLENRAGDRIKKKIIGIRQSQIPIEIGEEQIVNNMDFEEKQIDSNGGV